MSPRVVNYNPLAPFFKGEYNPRPFFDKLRTGSLLKGRTTPLPPLVKRDYWTCQMKIYYNPKLKARARELRNNSTLSEVLLWNQLKARKMKGYQFMRQKPIGKYIVDFFCSKLRLVIEIDGDSHIDKVEYDKKRQQELKAIGFYFLRFSDLDVKSNLNGVLQMIEKWIEEFETTP